MTRKPASDALIAPLLKDFDFNTKSPALRKRFQEDYKKELVKLWELFLFDVAIEEAAKKYPKLLTPLEETPLSGRAKNILRAADVKNVAGIAIYSASELKMFRNMGKATLAEIEDYLMEVFGE